METEKYFYHIQRVATIPWFGGAKPNDRFARSTVKIFSRNQEGAILGKISGCPQKMGEAQGEKIKILPEERQDR